MIYRDELDALAQQLDLTLVHILERPPDQWRGEEGFVTREVLDRQLPRERRAGFHCFPCGPAPMTRAAADALRDLGVPAERIHTEFFELV